MPSKLWLSVALFIPLAAAALYDDRSTLSTPVLLR